MSFRAILIGFLFAMFLAMAGHFNDAYMRQTYLVGNFFPISVIGLLVLIVLLFNPVLRLLRPSWKLRAGEPRAQPRITSEPACLNHCEPYDLCVTQTASR